jgi:conjugal transfer pilus assembly protein TraA
MKNISNKQKLLLLAVASAMIVLPEIASAGTDATFGTAVQTITEWLSGSLGRLISMALIAVGIIGGIARQSLMGFAIGIGSGLGLANAGTIIGTMYTATLVIS